MCWPPGGGYAGGGASMATPKSASDDVARRRATKPVVDDIERHAPPEALEAEQSVLGCLLLAYADVRPLLGDLSPAVFYRETHRRVFEALTSVGDRGEPVDLVTASAELQRRGWFDDCGGGEYLMALASAVPTWRNATTYARLVVTAAGKREWLAFSSELAEHASNGVGPDYIARRCEEQAAAVADLMPAALLGDVDDSPFLSVASLLTDPPVVPDPIIGSESAVLLPAGELTVVSGASKGGKTTFVAAASVAIAAGRPFLGMPTRQGTVVYVQADDPVAFWTRRVGMIAKALQVEPGELDGHFYTSSEQRLLLDDRSDVDRLLRHLSELQPSVVVLDPLRRLMAGEENSATDMAQVIRNLDRIRDELGCALVLVHHSRKTRQDDDERPAAERMRGSSALRGAGNVLSMYPTLGHESVTCELELKNAQPVPPFTIDLLFDGTDLDIAFGGLAGTKQERDRREAVVFALHGEDGLTAAQIAKQAGLEKRTARRILTQLATVGQAEKCGETTVKGNRADLWRAIEGASGDDE